jgi:succinyl-diaminopimelate desuccinylase
MHHFLLLQRRATLFACLFGLLFCGMSASGHEAFGAPFLPNSNVKENGKLQSVLNVLGNHRELIVAMQRELVARPAIAPENGGSGEEGKARWVSAWLHERGIDYERLDFPDERVPAKVRPNIVAVYPRKETGRTLWLLSHFDVPAAGPRELWDSDPFLLRMDGDAMYGRGVEDNNQAIAVSLLLLESLRITGVAPPVRVGLVLTSGALTDYRIGIGHVLSRKPDLFSPDDLIVVMDFGDAEGGLIGVGEKGNIWLKMTVTGRGGHAGTPDKAVNAFTAGAALAIELRGLRREFPAENALFSPPYTTITPTKTEDNNTGINHIPAKFTFYVDARVMPDYTFEEVEKAIRRLADKVEESDGVRIVMERVNTTAPSLVTPTEAPVLASLGRAIGEQLGIRPRHTGTGSLTVASLVREKGFPVAVWGIQETLRNRANEYALLSAHVKQAQVIARMLFDRELSMPGAHTSGKTPGSE